MFSSVQVWEQMIVEGFYCTLWVINLRTYIMLEQFESIHSGDYVCYNCNTHLCGGVWRVEEQV